jgi:hypothetical protein
MFRVALFALLVVRSYELDIENNFALDSVTDNWKHITESSPKYSRGTFP